MSSKNDPVAVAKENLADGHDSIKEAVKSIRRVIKSHPDLEPDLTNATAQLRAAETSLRCAGERLPKA